MVRPKEQSTPARRLSFDSDFEKLTHYLFRYPAKFHPPAVRELLLLYSSPGERLIDPFCGSGTMLVEAAVAGRHAIGTDVDPVAAFVSEIKTTRYDMHNLSQSCQILLTKLDGISRPKSEYVLRQFQDVPVAEVAATVEAERLWVPQIPNLFHWFRRYVIIDLARIHKELMSVRISRKNRRFLLLCFASIIRAASNADPVPVSGLEVTAHMKRKDATGRIIDPFDLMRKAIRRCLPAAEAYNEKVSHKMQVSVFQADATRVASRIKDPVDGVVTSPPYHNAVDYYRRHQLEMFWLGLTQSQEHRLALLPRYIGRPKVAMRHPYVSKGSLRTPLAREWESLIRQVKPERANAFKHYVVGMRRSLEQMALVLQAGRYALFIVGHSTWNGAKIPTTDLFQELAAPWFVLEERLWYPVQNRYMSYNRHNGASIEEEYVLVFKRSQADVR